MNSSFTLAHGTLKMFLRALLGVFPDNCFFAQPGAGALSYSDDSPST